MKESNDDLKQALVEHSIANQELSQKYLSNLLGMNVSKQDTADINAIMKDNEERYNELLSLVLEHKHILKDPSCPDLISYVRAMKYVGYLTMGKSFYDAYVASHSDVKDVQGLIMNGKREVIENRAKLFGKSKLVLKITQALDAPLCWLYAGFRHQAIDRLREEMNKAPLPRDRIQAADRLLAHLAPTLEQTTNILNVNVNTGTEQKNILETYKEAMLKFVEEKKTLLESANKNGDVIDVKEVINLGAKNE
jgi:hypothetical protein